LLFCRQRKQDKEIARFSPLFLLDRYFARRGYSLFIAGSGLRKRLAL
jgi:hypothetical protein